MPTRQKHSIVGRMAPSPTGLLHMGNAWSFLLAWLASRLKDGRIILRIEDLDPDRSKQAWTDAIIRDLAWLGLDWDEGPDVGGDFGPYRQSQRFGSYEATLEMLRTRGLIYPCFCTRKELREMAGAPHGAADGLSDCGAPYPGTCRTLSQQEAHERIKKGAKASMRLRCPDGEEGRISFADALCGNQSFTLTDCGGDFVVLRSDGVWAYQLAVVCDDISMGVNQVVRGNDILSSTPRQLWLYHLLGAALPQFMHVPLLCDAQGERLAKRHGSLSIAALRDRGCKAERIIGWLAWTAGLADLPQPSTPWQLAHALRGTDISLLAMLRRQRIIIPENIELLL